MTTHNKSNHSRKDFTMLELSENYRENIKRLDEALRVDENFDLIKKTLYIGKDEITLYYIDGFVQGGPMQKLMIYFLSLKGLGTPETNTEDAAATYFAQHHVPYVEADVTCEPTLMIQMILSGATLLIGETFGKYAIVIDSRTYPTRSVAEPENDRVMLGPRDGFVETIVFNTALIRRRIRDTNLTMQYLTVGKESKTDVVLCYLKGKADDEYVAYLEKKLRSIDTKSVTLGHESLAELLIKRRWYNPFPKIRYTERPDAAAAQILEGSIILLCDTSPEAMILPSTIFDFLQETNDFYFPPLTGTYIRLVRHLVFWSTLFMIPLWFLMVKNPQDVPSWLRFVLPNERGRVPIFVQLIVVEFTIDGLRMASMNTPNMLSNSLSVVGGLILGDFAVGVGWLIPEVIVFMAFVTIANFTQRSYELGYAFKFMRVSLIILIQLFNYVGLIVGTVGIVALLVSNRSVNGKHSYLYPLIPFNGKALLSLFVRLRKDQFSGKEQKSATESAKK